MTAALSELTEEEMRALSAWDDGSYNCPCRMRCMCDDADRVHLFDAVATIVASRERAAAEKAWDEGYMRGQHPWIREDEEVDPIPEATSPPTRGRNANPYRTGRGTTMGDAQEAWERWNNQPERNWPDGSPAHQAFMAGQVAALTEAADALAATSTQHHPVAWLRRRAAEAGD